MDSEIVAVEVVNVTVVVELTVIEVEADATDVVVVEVVTVAVPVELADMEVEADVTGVVELCSVALETLDEKPEVAVPVEVVIMVDVDADVEADAAEVIVEVMAGAPDGKLTLATSPSRTATMTAAPALAPTFPY